MARQTGNRVSLNMRVSQRTSQYLTLLCDKLDTTQTSVAERAIRELAEREGIRLPTTNTAQEVEDSEKYS